MAVEYAKTNEIICRGLSGAIPSTLSNMENTVLKDKVEEALRTVNDPEIPVNIFELGLVYGIAIDDNNKVTVTMTLTAPACPVAGDILFTVEDKVRPLKVFRMCMFTSLLTRPGTNQ